MSSSTVFVLKKQANGWVSETLPCGNMPVKVVMRALGKAGFVAKIHPTLPTPGVSLVSLTTFHAYNSRTGAVAHHKVQVDYHANSTGYCETPSPFTFSKGPRLADLVNDDGTITVEVTLATTNKTAQPIIFAKLSNTPSTSSSSSGPRPVHISKPNRESFGVVGLRNTGASCYLNSTLQVLFHCPAFRRLIFDIDAKAGPPREDRANVLLNLQILFHNMQLSSSDQSPLALMTSFGWGAHEHGRQQDASEMWVVLVDNIRDKLTPPLRDRLNRLFFTSASLVKSNEELGFHDESDESFSILSVAMVGCRNIAEAVQSYFAPQVVEDYIFEGFGRGNVVIRHQIKGAPAVLVVQLERYGRDAQTAMLSKLTDTVSVEERLALPVGEAVVEYALHGVFMHSGGMGGGHYFVFVRPAVEQKWFSISDTYIRLVELPEVLRDASRSGYCFIYARLDAQAETYGPFADDEIPERVRALVRTTELAFTEVTLLRDDSVSINCARLKPGFRSDAEHVIEVPQTETAAQLYADVARHFEFAEDGFRLWICDYSGRPKRFLGKTETAIRTICQGSVRIFFIDTTPFEAVKDDQCLVFLKLFSPAEASVQLSGITTLARDTDIAAVTEGIREPLFHDAADTRYDVFVEFENGRVEAVSPERKLQEEILGCGCVLVFQRYAERYVLSVVLPADTSATNYFATAKATGTYDFFVTTQRRMVHAHVHMGFDSSHAPIAVRYPSSLTLGELKGFIAGLVGVRWDPAANALVLFTGEPGCLAFAGFDNARPQPLEPSADGSPLRVHVQCPPGINEVSARDWRALLVYTVTGTDVATAAFCFPRATLIAAVVSEMGIAGNFVLSEWHGGAIGRALTPQTAIRDFYGDLRVDILPPEWRLQEMRLLPVHVLGEQKDRRGFWIDLRPGEILKDTRTRIMAELPGIDPRAALGIRFKEHTEQRPAETVALWDLHGAISGLEIRRQQIRHRDGPGVVIRN